MPSAGPGDRRATPRLLGFAESGSFYCGGAYPNNFWTLYLVDAKTSRPLVAEQLLRGWVAHDADGAVVDPKTVKDQSSLTFGPDDALAKFVTTHLDAGIDTATKTDCGIDDLHSQQSGRLFHRDRSGVQFQGLPHAIFACTNDLVTVPLKDARPLLTEAGAAYFEVLDH